MVTTASDRRVAWWLIACAATVYLTLVVGGITRLTHSGLSIAQWKPVVGTLPPLSEAHWQAEFATYQQTPEYRKVNAGMSLDEFKSIYRVEWIHRLLGRLAGAVFLLPLLVLMARGDVSRRLLPRLLGLFALGGAQGVLGWYMVKSGLVNDPHVSPLRLTAHLGLAVLIYAGLLWTALDLLSAPPAASAPGRRAARAFAALVYAMILSGGMVAGTRAGFAFNTFPLMRGALVPQGLLGLQPWWRNFLENVLTVQFTHRGMALLVCAGAVAVWLVRRRAGAGGVVLHLLPLAVLAQVILGIATLVKVVPVPLAAAHQAVALVVFTLALMVAQAAGRETSPH